MALHNAPRSSTGIDLNSRTTTETPRILFKKAYKDKYFVAVFTCQHPVDTCLRIREWLVHELGTPEHGHDMLRFDEQSLDTLRPNVEATLLWAPGLGHMKGVEVALLALVLPHDPNIRWFYSIKPTEQLLVRLEQRDLIKHKATLEPGTTAHMRSATLIERLFLEALRYPDSPDYVSAMKITDWAPEIEDPREAESRIYQIETLHTTKEKDLQDDRYLLELPGVERTLAALLDLHCAEYLLIKRKFFQDFYRQVQMAVRTQEDGAEIVRTVAAHTQWLQANCDWSHARARRLVYGWRALGILDEKRLRPSD